MWSKKKRRKALRTLSTYGRPHRKLLLTGGLATLFLVIFRLALPWPLRGAVEFVFPNDAPGGGVLLYFSETAYPVLWFAGLYAGLAVACGLAEYFQRIHFTTYAARTVHDLRETAVVGASTRRKDTKSTADLIARVIGDSARLKAGLSGILVHLSHNGLTFIGICTVLTFISWKLGVVFISGGLIAIFVGLKFATPIADNAQRQRRKEGRYAGAVQEKIDHGEIDLDLEGINESSARKDVKNTRLIATSSLFVHSILAMTVGVALWIGSSGVQAGTIAPGALFIFIAYSLTMHRRMVQVGRQTARTGKVVACAQRLGVLVENMPSATEATLESALQEVALKEGLRLQGATVISTRGENGELRLRKTTIEIRSGERVAIIGEIGSGKSTLLQILAGKIFPTDGKVFWDNEKIEKGDPSVSFRSSYLSPEPVFSPTRVWKLLGLEETDRVKRKTRECLKGLGAWTVIKRLPSNLLEKVSSRRLSRNESRLLSLAGIVVSSQDPMWILDNPLGGVRGDAARRRLKVILRKGKGRTIVMALPHVTKANAFDRIIEMKRGKICFDGTPEEWKAKNELALATAETVLEPQERRL